MSKRKRRNFTVEEKATILRKHLVEKKAVSDICDEHGLSPSQFYRWQQALMENMEVALGNGGGRRKRAGAEVELRRKLEVLEGKLAKKDSVIAEMSAEYVALKKELGEL